MITGKTASGFSYSVDPEIVKDYEYLELAAGVRNDGLLFPSLVEFTLGKEQKNALVAHLKGIHGRARTEDLTAEYAEIVKAMAAEDSDVKN